MEIGLRIFPGAPVRALTEAVRRAEASGFTDIWICDDGLTRDVYVALAHMAGATQRIRLGTGITNPYTRHPVVTGVAMATLHELSGGRAFLGLGTGGNLALDPMGLVREQPLARIRDTVRVLRSLWAGERVTYEGKTLSVREAALAFPCSDLELWIATRGPQITRLASQVADGLCLSSIPKSELFRVQDTVRSAERTLPRPVKVAWVATVITDETTRRKKKPHFAYALVDSPPEIWAKVGLSEPEILRIKETIHTQGLEAASALMPDTVLDEMALVGTPEQVAEEIRSIAKRCALDQVVINTDLFSKAFDDAISVAKRLG